MSKPEGKAVKLKHPKMSRKEIEGYCRSRGLSLERLDAILAGSGVTPENLAGVLFVDVKKIFGRIKPDPWNRFLKDGPPKRKRTSLALLQMAKVLEEIYFPILLVPDKPGDMRNKIVADIPNPEALPGQLRRLADHLKIVDLYAPLNRKLASQRKPRRDKRCPPNIHVYMLVRTFITFTGKPRYSLVGEILDWYMPNDNGRGSRFNTAAVEKMYERGIGKMEILVPGLGAEIKRETRKRIKKH